MEFLIKNEENTTQEFKTHLLENLNTMVSYCENQVDCRRKLQLAYLGEEFDSSECKQTCDNCRNSVPHVKKDVTDSARDLIDLLKEISRNSIQITSNQLVQVFRGKENQALRSKGLLELKLYGKGSEYSKVDAERIIRYLVEKQAFREITESNGLGYPVNYIQLNEHKAINLKNSKERILLSFAQAKKNVSATRKKKASNSGSVDGILFGKLSKLRGEIAMELNQPAYHVFQNASLEEMARVKPCTLGDLEQISGMGKIKLKKFGEKFLQVIVQHVQNKSPFFKGDSQAPKRSAPSYVDHSILDEDIVEDDEDNDDDYEDYVPQKSAFFQASTKRYKKD